VSTEGSAKYWREKWKEAAEALPSVLSEPKEEVKMVSPNQTVFNVTVTDDGTLDVSEAE